MVFSAAFGLLCHHCYSCYKKELRSHEVIYCFSSRRELGTPVVYVHRWEGSLGTFRHRLYTNIGSLQHPHFFSGDNHNLKSTWKTSLVEKIVWHHCYSCYKTELCSHEVILCFSSKRELGRPVVDVHRWFFSTRSQFFFSGDKSQPQIYLEKYPSWKIVWKSDRLSRAPAYTRVNDQIWIGSGPTCSWMLRIFKVEINSLSVKFNEGKLVRLWIIIRFVFGEKWK